MKALSLTQPYANWIADGSKRIETRSWKTNYRGRLLICATKQKVLDDEGFTIGPRGMAICTVEVFSCVPMTEKDSKAARFNYRPGLWAWGLRHIRTFDPFPIKGQLNIFNVDHEEVFVK